MQKHKSKFEFAALLTFLTAAALLLSNGFVARISADEDHVDVYRKIEPIGGVLATIQREYVRDADIDLLVEGALRGMMRSLDQHSSFISTKDLEQMREDTRGEFEGIGISIRLDEDEVVMVVAPIPGSPAAEAGLLPYDRIVEIDGVTTFGMDTADAAQLIRGQRGTTVTLGIWRPSIEEDNPGEEIEVEVRRDRVPLVSITESGMIDDKIGYVRVKDFKETTADDLSEKIEGFLDEGMQAFILDLRWNPGGLLNASVEVSDLFLPKGTLVTYTEGRTRVDGTPNRDDMRYKTQRRPVLPKEIPVIILVNNQTASSSEIVTGALQYYERAIVLGEPTYGKGSVQTIIPLERPESTALRLTIALYYTPAEVTIDQEGIKPDVEVTMEREHLLKLVRQMDRSFEADPLMGNGILNHGVVSGYEAPENANPGADGEEAEEFETVEDLQLERAVEILREDSVWQNLLRKYHKNVSETQVAHTEETSDDVDEEASEEPGAAEAE